MTLAAQTLSWGEVVLLVALLTAISGVVFGVVSFRELMAKNAVDVTVGDIRSSLRLTLAAALLSGRRGELSALAGSNPVALLATPPSGYRGERRHADGLAAGSWYFDSASRELVYLPQVAPHLHYLGAGGGGLRWKLVATQVGSGNAEVQSTGGIALVTTSFYVWFATEYAPGLPEIHEQRARLHPD